MNLFHLFTYLAQVTVDLCPSYHAAPLALSGVSSVLAAGSLQQLPPKVSTEETRICVYMLLHPQISQKAILVHTRFSALTLLIQGHYSADSWSCSVKGTTHSFILL